MQHRQGKVEDVIQIHNFYICSFKMCIWRLFRWGEGQPPWAVWETKHCQHWQWEAPAQPHGRRLSPGARIPPPRPRGSHRGAHMCTWDMDWHLHRKKPESQEKHKIPRGWEQEGFQPDKSAPNIYILLATVNKPFSVFKSTNNKSAAVHKFSTAEK